MCYWRLLSTEHKTNTNQSFEYEISFYINLSALVRAPPEK